MPRHGLVSILLLVALVGGACGGGDDVQAYCDAVSSSEGSEIPSEEEVQEVRDSAPDEIADDINVIADAIDEFRETEDPAVLQDPDVQAAVERTEEFEDENCEE